MVLEDMGMGRIEEEKNYDGVASRWISTET